LSCSNSRLGENGLQPPAPPVAHLLKRLRLHGFIQKAGRRCTYDLTCFGRGVIASGFELRELFINPQLALHPCP